MTGHIDVHMHMIPTSYAQWLRDHGVHAPGGRELPEWSPELALELMDRQGIATAILSLSTPGVHLDDGTDAPAMARSMNEFGAELVKDHAPQRPTTVPRHQVHPRPRRRLRPLRGAPPGLERLRQTGRDLNEVLDDLAGFFFDTAMSASSAREVPPCARTKLSASRCP
jgi:hypothetical protein